MKQTERNTETKNALFAVIVLTIGMIAFLVPMVFQLGIVIECVSYWRDNSQIDEFDYEYKKIPPMARTMTDQEYEDKRNTMIRAQEKIAETNKVYAVCLECKDSPNMRQVWICCVITAVLLTILFFSTAVKFGIRAYRWSKKLGRILEKQKKNDSGKHYYSRGF